MQHKPPAQPVRQPVTPPAKPEDAARSVRPRSYTSYLLILEERAKQRMQMFPNHASVIVVNTEELLALIEVANAAKVFNNLVDRCAIDVRIDPDLEEADAACTALSDALDKIDFGDG